MIICTGVLPWIVLDLLQWQTQSLFMYIRSSFILYMFTIWQGTCTKIRDYCTLTFGNILHEKLYCYTIKHDTCTTSPKPTINLSFTIKCRTHQTRLKSEIKVTLFLFARSTTIIQIQNMNLNLNINWSVYCA